MKRLAASLALALLLAALARGGGPRVKGEKAYKFGEKIKLVASDFSSAKAQFLWDVDGECETEEGVLVVRDDKDKKSYVEGGALYIWPAKAGKYRVVLTAVDFETKTIERARFTFAVEGQPAPSPPGPGPAPGPGPETALQKAVRDAYAIEADPDRAKHAKALAGVYRAAAKAVADQRPATAGAVWSAISAGAKAAGVTGKIVNVQKALQAELKKLPSKTTEALDDAKRAAVVATFNDCALALERLEVKGRG